MTVVLKSEDQIFHNTVKSCLIKPPIPTVKPIPEMSDVNKIQREAMKLPRPVLKNLPHEFEPDVLNTLYATRV